MAVKNKRQRQLIKREAVEQLKGDFTDKFQNKKKTNTLNLKQMVELMADQIQTALDNNWSYQDCCDLLLERGGIKIAPETLQQYMREVKHDSESKSKVATGKKKKSTNTDVNSKQKVEAVTEDTSQSNGSQLKEKRFNTLDRSKL